MLAWRSMVEDDTRLAVQVANEVAREVMARGWPVGHALGSVSQLMKRLNVSREPFREGLRILEWQGIVATERGAHGGVVVAAGPDVGIAGILQTYLELSDVRFEEILDAWKVLHDTLYVRAAERATASDIEHLRELAVVVRQKTALDSRNRQPMLEFTDALRKLSGSLVGFVFGRVMQRSLANFIHPSRFPQQVREAGMQESVDGLPLLIEGLRLRDAEMMARINASFIERVRDICQALERSNPRVWSTVSFLRGKYEDAVADVRGPQKAAARVAYDIAAEIRRNQLAPGSVLGQQVLLYTQKKVSRAIFREAIRMLEFFGVVQAKRGVRGGLVAIEHDPTNVLESVVAYMPYLKAKPKDVQLLITQLSEAAIGLVATRLAADDVLMLSSATQRLVGLRGKGQQEAAGEFAEQIVSLSRNGPLQLFRQVLIRSSGGSSLYKPADPDLFVGEIERTMEQVKNDFIIGRKGGAGESLLHLYRTLTGAEAASNRTRARKAVVSR